MKKLSDKIIRSDMRKLMKCMNYILSQAESSDFENEREIFDNIYQVLGSHAWNDIANQCEHKFRISKKYPTGRCKNCGTIRRKK
jgi:hypothetical protein